MAKVLLVEDDNNLREIYEARLAAEGYEIATAKDGEDALAVAKQFKPDLVVSDVMMPRISGFEMLDILRNTDGLKHIKIIMLTALGQAEDKGRAEDLGADRYLVKSQVTLEDIVKAAEELLNPDAVAPPEAAPTPPSDDTLVSAATAVSAQLPVQAPTDANAPSAGQAPEPPTVSPQEVAPQPAAVAAPMQPESEEASPQAAGPLAEPDFAAIIDSAAAEPSAAPTPQQPTEMPAPPPQETVAITATPPVESTQAKAQATPPPEISVVDSPVAVAQTPDTSTGEQQTPAPQAVGNSAAATAQVAEALSTAQETAAIEQQIENFENTVTDTPIVAAEPTPVGDEQPISAVPQPAADTAQEDLINQAADELANSMENTAAASIEAPSESTPTADPDSTSQIPGKKVIQPLPNSQESAPDINTLLAQEEARENQAQGVAGPAVVVSAVPVAESAPALNEATPQQPAEPVATPPPTPADATIQQPESVFIPNNNGDANTTAL